MMGSYFIKYTMRKIIIVLFLCLIVEVEKAYCQMTTTSLELVKDTVLVKSWNNLTQALAKRQEKYEQLGNLLKKKKFDKDHIEEFKKPLETFQNVLESSRILSVTAVNELAKADYRLHKVDWKNTFRKLASNKKFNSDKKINELLSELETVIVRVYAERNDFNLQVIARSNKELLFNNGL